jgi:hypothetical protein
MYDVTIIKEAAVMSMTQYQTLSQVSQQHPHKLTNDLLEIRPVHF